MLHTTKQIFRAAILVLFSVPALGQIQEDVPPIHETVDGNGVDIVTGEYNFVTTEVAIGPSGAVGLVHSRRFNGNRTSYGWMDTLAGTVALQRDTGGAITGAVVSLDGGSVSFDYDNTNNVYVPKSNSGASLTVSGSTYTYTGRYGEVARFSTTYSDKHFWRVDGAVIIDLTMPNGAVRTYNHRSASTGGQTRYRIQSVTNSYGFHIHYEYADNSPANTTELNGVWMQRTKAIGINRAYTYCAPTAYTCSGGSYSWPYVTYSEPSSSLERVTNALGQNTDYNFHFSYGGLSQIIRHSGEVATGIIYSTSTDQVTTLTQGGLKFNYSNATLVTGDKYYRTLKTMEANGLGTARTGFVRVDYDLEPRGVTKVTKFASTTGASGASRWVEYVRNTQSQVTLVKDHTGRETHYDYDGRGNLEVTTVKKNSSDPNPLITEADFPNSCDSSNIKYCNKPSWTEDTRGFRTYFTYYSHGGIKDITYPGKTGSAPDGTGDTAQERFGYTTRTARYLTTGSGVYSNGVSTTVLSSKSVCNTGNNSCNGQARETDTTYGFEASGSPNNILVTSVTAAAGNASVSYVSQTVTFDWDAYARLKWVDSPRSGPADRTYFQHDVLGRRTITNGPDPDASGSMKHRAVRTNYDSDGFVTSVEQGTMTGTTNWTSFAALGRAEVYYDSYGRAIERRYKTGSTTHSVVQTSFDLAGRLECTAYRMNASLFGSLPSSACSQTSGGAVKDRISKNHYNNYDDLVRVQSGLGTALVQDTQTIVPNTLGFIDTLTDAEGNLTKYTYDAYGRPYRTYYPSKTTAGSYSTTDYEQINYGTYGRVLSMRIRDGQTFSFGYDNLGRMTSRNAPGSDPDVSFTHDNLGRVKTMSQTGHTLSYDYNALGQLTKATGPKGDVTYQYNAEGLRSRMDYPGAGGFYVNYDYNAAGDLEKIREKGATDPNSVGILADFEYDDWGRRKTLTRGNGVVTTYGFDAAGRLDLLVNNLSGTTNDQTLTFDFNTANQIIKRTNTNSAYDYSAYTDFTDAYVSNGLNQYSTVDGTTQSYDGRGNLTSDGTNSYTYDNSNRLKTAPGSVSFGYDPGGRLYQETVGSTSKQFLYDGIDLIAEYSGSTVTKRYVHGPGIDEPLVEYSGTGTSNRTFLIADERGSIVAGTNSTGAKTYINTYDEYGVPGPGNQGRFQYTGQIYLDSIDLYHYKARTYDPKTGRFLQADPIGYAAGMNMYSYVSGDPMNLVDPLGLEGHEPYWSDPNKDARKAAAERQLNWFMNYQSPGMWSGSYLGNGATAQPDGRDGGPPGASPGTADPVSGVGAPDVQIGGGQIASFGYDQIYVDLIPTDSVRAKILQAIAKGDYESARFLIREAAAMSSKEVAKWAQKSAAQRGQVLLKKYRDLGKGQGARSGQHGTPWKNAGADLIREGNKLPPGPYRDALKALGKQYINKGKGWNH
ncbi:MAG: RHS repeat-associated core domain-containing protein [Woeseiaceae bacterium]|nr:RHS repeat-associated core domain-containing protein [Woeseiaceae bacterium]